jgi:hypothetical protein
MGRLCEGARLCLVMSRSHRRPGASRTRTVSPRGRSPAFAHARVRLRACAASGVWVSTGRESDDSGRRQRAVTASPCEPLPVARLGLSAAQNTHCAARCALRRAAGSLVLISGGSARRRTRPRRLEEEGRAELPARELRGGETRRDGRRDGAAGYRAGRARRSRTRPVRWATWRDGATARRRDGGTARWGR